MFSGFSKGAKGTRAIQNADVLGKDLNAAREAISNILLGLGESAQPVVRQFARSVGLLPETGSAGVRMGGARRGAAPAPAPRPTAAPQAYEAARGLMVDPQRALRTTRPAGSPAPRPAFGPGAAEPPAQPLIDRLMPISRTPEGVPSAPVLPGSTQTLANPLQGTQLDLLSGFNRLRYPAGARTADDVAIGGTTYSPNIRMPENEYTQRIRELARSKGLDEEMVLDAMRNPGRSLAEEVDFASITPETGFFRTMQGPDLPPGGVVQRAPRPAFGPDAQAKVPTDIAVDRAFALGRGPAVEELSVLRDAAGGLRQIDLKRLAPYLGVGGVTGLGVGTYMYQQMNPQVGQTTATPDVSIIPSQILQDAEQTPSTLPVPGSPAANLPGQVGAGSVTVRLNGAREEALNEARQNAASARDAAGLTGKQRELLDYYRQREAYTQDPRTKPTVLAQFAEMGGRFDDPDMAIWAAKNPQLAYELMEKMQGRRPAPSQQTPQQVMAGPATTELGTNTRNNSLFNSAITGQTAVEPTQANSDLRDATAPKYVPQQLVGPGQNPGYNMYGYPLVNPYI